MRVTKSSKNLIDELQNYEWLKDRLTGQKTNTPQDAFNHAIDAMRYLFMSKLGKKRKASPFKVI
jgi:phage terminase large subunit